MSRVIHFNKEVYADKNYEQYSIIFDFGKQLLVKRVGLMRNSNFFTPYCVYGLIRDADIYFTIHRGYLCATSAAWMTQGFPVNLKLDKLKVIFFNVESGEKLSVNVIVEVD